MRMLSRKRSTRSRAGVSSASPGGTSRRCAGRGRGRPWGWRGEGQRGAHGVEDAGADVGGGDAGEQARRGDDMVVHAAGLAAPGQRALEVVEQLIVAADPAWDV